MNSKKLFFVLIALLVLINGSAIAAIVLGNKQLQKQTTRLNELKVEEKTIEQVQASLVRAKKDIDQYAGLEQIARTVIPQEKDQARTIREIIKLAEESGIAIASVSFPSFTLGNEKAQQSKTAGTDTQTQKVEGINNVERLEITVTSDTAKPILYTNFISFLEALEQNRRTAQVSNVSIQPLSDNRNLVTFSLIVNVYIEK